jgi:hypothetical protein
MRTMDTVISEKGSRSSTSGGLASRARGRVPRELGQRVSAVDVAAGRMLDLASELCACSLVAERYEIESAGRDFALSCYSPEFFTVAVNPAVALGEVGLCVHSRSKGEPAATLPIREPARKNNVPSPVIPFLSRVPDHDLMDNKAVRKANVAMLVRMHQGPTAFGQLIERDQVQVSQWLGGKPIGDRLARHIEEKLGKPKGWLDVLQDDASGGLQAAPLQGSHHVRLDFTKLSEAVYVAQQFLQILGKQHDDLLPPELLEAAYEAVETLSDGDGSNVVDLMKFMSRRMQERAVDSGESEKADAARAG